MANVDLDDIGSKYDRPKRVAGSRRDRDLLTAKAVDNKPQYYNLPPVPARNIPGQDLPDAPPPSRAGTATKGGQKRRPTAKNLYYRPMTYTVEEVPPWLVCIFLGFQHYLIMFGATVANPMVMTEPLCIDKDDTETKAQLMGTIFVVAGICTILQATVGVRLPIVQGGTFTFVAPSIALLSLPKWKCKPDVSMAPIGLSDNITSFTSTSAYIATTMAANITTEPLWLPRIREVQGAIIVSSLFQVLIGFSGVVGLMLRFIGPLSIAPTISLAGLALFEVAAAKSQGQWWITLVTVVLIAAFSQYTKNIKIPCISFERGKGFLAEPFPIFRLFPVILAIGITWVICAILTAAGVFSYADRAGTSNQLEVLEKADWFRVPYPGQWGVPTVSSAGVFGLLAGVLTSIVESVGDYYACARMARVPPPPVHAINRGIGVEGIGCILAGAFGSGSGTTSYSENIGAIGITKVGSRRVIQCAGAIMIVFGIFNKFGSIFVTIPEPIVGGVFIVTFGMIVAVGLSNLQFVDLNSSRNLFIIGFSFFFGITLPGYLHKNPHAIKTGSSEVDQILTVLLKTSMFVGGISGFILDNTIPGTDEERGIEKWNTHAPVGSSEEELEAVKRCYELPFITRWLEKFEWTRYVPFLPTYEMGRILQCFGKSKKKGRRSQRRRRNNDNSSIV